MRFIFLIPVLFCLGVSLLSAGTLGNRGEPLHKVDVCYDYACSTRSSITFSVEEWQRIRRLFSDTVASPHEERQSIRRAIALMERIAGRQTPTFRDRAGNNKFQNDGAGQMDCIDESMNATSYLRLLEQNGLIKKHRLRERVSRAPHIFDFHWGAQIEEIGSGQRYVVDSWYFDNGELPVIQALEDWVKKRGFGG